MAQSLTQSLRVQFGKHGGKQELYDLHPTQELGGVPIRLSTVGVEYIHLLVGQNGAAPKKLVAKRVRGDLLLFKDDDASGNPLVILEKYYEQGCQIPVTGQVDGAAPQVYSAEADTSASSLGQLADGASSAQVLDGRFVIDGECLAPTMLGWKDGLSAALPALGLLIPGAGGAAMLPVATDPTPTPSAGYQVKTQVFLGEVRQGVKVLLFDKNGNLLGQTTEVVKEGDGYVATVTITNGYKGAIVAMVVDDNDVNGAAGGNYVDETTGQLTDIQLDAPMRAIVTDVDARQVEGGVVNVVISALTELATRLSGVPTPTNTSAIKSGAVPAQPALDDATFRSVAVAEQAIAEFFGIPASTGLSQLVPDITTDGVRDISSAAGKYGLALATLSGADALVVAADQALGVTSTNATDRTLNTLVAGLNFNPTQAEITFKADSVTGEAARASLVNGAIAFESANTASGASNPTGALQLVVTSPNFAQDNYESSLRVGATTDDAGKTDVFGSVGLGTDGKPELQSVFVVLEELDSAGKTVRTFKYGPIAVQADGSFSQPDLTLTAGGDYRMFATGRADDSTVSQSGEAVSPIVLFEATPDAVPAYLPLTAELGPDATGAAARKPVVRGEGVAGSVVEVTFPNGEIVTVTVAALTDDKGALLTYDDGQPRGSWSATATTDQPHGTADIIVTERRGENLARTTVPVTVDLQPPAAPVITEPLTQNADGTLSVFGTAEPNAQVTITFPDGSTATAQASANGAFGPITSATAQPDNGTVAATATDASGNTSGRDDARYVGDPSVDASAPAAPQITKPVTQNPDGTVSVSGTAEPGATVTVNFPDGSVGTAVAGRTGAFGPVTSSLPQPDNGTVGATATDASGNASGSDSATYEGDPAADTTAPRAPQIIEPVTQNPDGTVSVSGTAEPGSQVTITFPDGTTRSAVVGRDGAFGPVTSSVPQPDNGTISAVATDASGNASGSDTASYVGDATVDTTAPTAPQITEPLTQNPDGTVSIFGSAEPGARVTITFPDGSTASGVAGPNGAFGPITSSLPQPDNGTVTAVSDDASGNRSGSDTAVYTGDNNRDSQEPTVPVITEPVTQNSDGTISVSGTAEPGSRVRITFPDGSTGTAVTGPNGAFGPVTSQVAQPDNGVVQAVAFDASGNGSLADEATYTGDSSLDTTAPVAPTITEPLMQNLDGTVSVIGTAEPGAQVRLTFPDGSTATTVTGADGNWGPLTSAVPQPDNGVVTAVAIDASGNTSGSDSATYVGDPAVDVLNPAAPVITEPLTQNPDGTVSVSGTAEPGSRVTITFPDGSTGTATTGANGAWGPVTSSVAQPDNGVITAQATDASGNPSGDASANYTGNPAADTTAPSAPVITEPLTQNANGTMSVTGTAEPGSLVTITFPDGSTGTATTGANGAWGPVTSTVAQPDNGSVTATARDASGNSSGSDTAVYVGNATADTTAPLSPAISEPVTQNANGTVSVSGTAEPGALVTVTFPDGSTGTATAGRNGNWGPVTSSVAQPDNSQITAVATDASGNSSAPANAQYTGDNTADTAAPSAPVITEPLTQNADGTVGVSGTAEPGALVTITFPDGSQRTGVTRADGSFGPINSLVAQPDNGTVTATARDASGNTSGSDTATYAGDGSADTTAPVAPVITEPLIQNANGTVSVAGTAEPGSLVTVTFPDGSTGTATTGANGAWGPVTSSVAQPDNGTVSATARDASGNSSGSDTAVYTGDGTADTTAPAAPVITEPLTQNANGTVTVNGTAEPGSLVTVTFPDGSTGTATTGANGAWGPVTSSVAQPDNGTVTATARDASGNSSGSDTATYTGDGTADTTAPAAPVITEPLTQNANGTVTVNGTAEPGSLVTVTFPDGSTGTATTGANGAWGPVTSSVAQPDNGTVSATARDASGNSSGSDTAIYSGDGTTDTTAPAAPVITEPLTQNANGTVTVNGTAEPGALVTVTFPDGSTGTATTGANGAWGPVTSTVAQPDNGTVSATARDASGNSSGSDTAIYTGDGTADTTAPAAPVITEPLTQNADGTVTVNGTAEPGSLVSVTFPDGSTGTATTGANGAWGPVTSAVAQPDNGTVSATARDASGNSSGSDTAAYSGDGTADTTAPAAPVITEPLTQNANGTVTVNGTAEPGSLVTVTFPDGSTGTATTGANGAWGPVTSSVAQPDNGTVTATARDASGNSSGSDTAIYTGDGTVDTTAPAAPVITEPLTQNPDGTVTVNGTAEPGSLVTVTFPDGSTGTATTGTNGTWGPVTSSVAQPDNGTVTATARDASGNSSGSDTAIYTGDGTVDTTAPAAPVITEPLTQNPDGTVTVNGTAEPGSLVTVTFPDGSTGTATTGANGAWGPVTSSVAQPDNGTVTATARDASGNNSGSDTAIYTGDGTVDTTAPAAPVITEPLTQNANGTVTVNGTAEPGSLVTVTFPDGSTGTATTGANGAWGPVTSGVAQPDNGTVTATARDASGNSSGSDTAIYTGDGTVDTTAPAAPVITEPLTQNANGTVSVFGTAEPGSLVTVTFPDGSTGTATTGANGAWGPVTSTVAQPDNGTVSATARDASGNSSGSDTAVYVGDGLADTTAPGTPTIGTPLAHNVDGTVSVSGTAEPGSLVTITFPDGSTGTGVTGPNGQYGPVTSATAQTDGPITAVALDASGNSSVPANATYTDGINAAPHGTDGVMSVNEDALLTLSAAHFGFADAASDTPANLLAGVQFTAVPMQGTLFVDADLDGVVDSGEAVTVGQEVSAADIDAGRLRYETPANAFGSALASMSFKVRDDGGTAMGGVDLAAAANTVAINVLQVNDAPVLDTAATLNLIPALEDAGVPTGAMGTLVNDLVTGFSDLDNNSAGIAVVGIDSTAGTLYYSTNGGTNWQAASGISESNALLLSADPLTRVFFSPNANRTSAVASALTLRGWDGTTGTAGGYADAMTRGGSTAFSVASDTVSLSITSVADAPAGADNTISAPETVATRIGFADFAGSGLNWDAADAAGAGMNAYRSIVFTNLPSLGTLFVDADNDGVVDAGEAVTVGQEVLVDTAGGSIGTASGTGLLKFLAPAVTANQTTSFDFQVRDDGGTANGGVDLDPTANTLTLNVQNLSLTSADSGSGTEDSNITGNVLTNDDPGLTVTGFSVAGVSGSFTVGSTAVIPFVGTLSIAANGAYTFTPQTNWSGTVPAITYNVSNGVTTDTGTLSLNTTPTVDAPVMVVQDVVVQQVISGLPMLSTAAAYSQATVASRLGVANAWMDSFSPTSDLDTVSNGLSLNAIPTGTSTVTISGTAAGVPDGTVVSLSMYASLASEASPLTATATVSGGAFTTSVNVSSLGINATNPLVVDATATNGASSLSAHRSSQAAYNTAAIDGFNADVRTFTLNLGAGEVFETSWQFRSDEDQNWVTQGYEDVAVMRVVRPDGSSFDEVLMSGEQLLRSLRLTTQPGAAQWTAGTSSFTATDAGDYVISYVVFNGRDGDLGAQLQVAFTTVQGTTIDVPSVSITDIDGSEELANITLSGLPAGFVLNGGTDLGGGSWSLTAAELDSLQITTPDSFTGTATLTLSAQARELTTGELSSSISKTFSINVVSAELQGNAGSTGNDYITGGNTSETLGGAGTNGDDYINGMQGDDTINGGAGADQLYGDVGNDTINGGTEGDLISGGAGSDTLTSGAGRDVLQWMSQDHGTAGAPDADVVTDFTTGSTGDILDLREVLFGAGSTNLGNFMHATLNGSDTVIHVSSTGGYASGYTAAQTDLTITLTGVDLITGNGGLPMNTFSQMVANGNLVI